MSRSFKKNGFSTFACYKSDKWCRTTYNKNRRHKDKISCRKYEGNLDSNFFVSDKDFPNNKIDYSVKFSDKYSWSSDGGQYFCDDLSSIRREFEKEAFSQNLRFHDTDTCWDKYKSCLEQTFNNKKRKWVVKLEKRVLIKINFSFYMPWNQVMFPSYETKVKYVTVETYPPKLIEENYFEDWEVKNWWSVRNYLSYSNWDLFGFLFKNNLIPLDFKNEEELLNWLKENQERIVEKWFKAKLLRK